MSIPRAFDTVSVNPAEEEALHTNADMPMDTASGYGITRFEKQSTCLLWVVPC